jgi:hypothetical protein
MADAVELQQPLPLRWPIGDDAIRMIHRRKQTSDDDWEREMRGFGWGFREEEVD